MEYVYIHDDSHSVCRQAGKVLRWQSAQENREFTPIPGGRRSGIWEWFSRGAQAAAHVLFVFALCVVCVRLCLGLLCGVYIIHECGANCFSDYVRLFFGDLFVFNFAVCTHSERTTAARARASHVCISLGRI